MAWESREHEGFRQVREIVGNRAGRWQFVVAGFNRFGDPGLCSVVRADGSKDGAPIDDRDRITINGRKFGRQHWRH